MLARDKQNGQLVCSVNAYIFFHPSVPHIKAVQAWLLTYFTRSVCRSCVDQGLANSPEDIGIVISGDFNSLKRKVYPDVFDEQLPEEGVPSGVYELITTGMACN